MIAGRRVDEELYAELEARADLAAGDPAAAEADRAASRLLGVGASLLLISLFVLSSSVDLLQSLPGPLVGASAPEGTSNGATGGVPRADSAPAGQRPSDPPGTEAGSADGTTGGGAGQLPSTPGGQPGGPGQPDQPPWVPQPGTTTPTPGVPSAPEQPPDPGAPAQPPANPDTVVVLRLSDDDGDRPMFSLPAMVPGSLVRRCLEVRYEGPAGATMTLTADVSGSIASYVDVTVERGTTGGFATCSGFQPQGTVFHGSLAALGAATVPVLTTSAEDQRVTFRVAVRLADVAAASGTSGSAAFAWAATS